MALVECRECGASVSSEANNCPQCGISNPQKGKVSFTAVFAILGSLVFAVAMLSNPKNNSEKSTSEAKNANWLIENGDNPHALDKRYSHVAQSSCSAGVDSYLREIANYDFAWDSEADNWGVKFDKMSNSSAGHGLLTLVSTMAKLSNQFGAFNHVRVFCLYDVSNDHVIRYSLSDPAAVIGNDGNEARSYPSNSIDHSLGKDDKNKTIVIYKADLENNTHEELQNAQ